MSCLCMLVSQVWLLITLVNASTGQTLSSPSLAVSCMTAPVQWSLSAASKVCTLLLLLRLLIHDEDRFIEISQHRFPLILSNCSVHIHQNLLPYCYIEKTKEESTSAWINMGTYYQSSEITLFYKSFIVSVSQHEILLKLWWWTQGNMFLWDLPYAHEH